jgi:hypothetical protein
MLRGVGALVMSRLRLLTLELCLLLGLAAFVAPVDFALRFLADFAAGEDEVLCFAPWMEATSEGAFAKEPVPGQSRHSSKVNI